MARVNENTKFNQSNSQSTSNSAERKPNPDWVQFFPKLADGEEIIVRFPYNSADQVDCRSVHNVDYGKRHVWVDCLRSDGSQPFDVCPLCASGSKLSVRGLIKLIYYANIDGVITPLATIWNCASEYVATIKSFINEYGDLSGKVFKLKRTGVGKGNTKYSIFPANPEFYKPEIYPVDFHAFENFNMSPWHLVEATREDMNSFLTTGVFPNFTKKQPASDVVADPQYGQVFTPSVAQAAPTVPAGDLYAATPGVTISPTGTAPGYQAFTPQAATMQEQAQVVQTLQTVAGYQVPPTGARPRRNYEG